MGLNELFATELLNPNFGSSKYVRDFKHRSHVSRSKVEVDGNVVYLKPGEMALRRYNLMVPERYIAARDLTYDFLFITYDVNTSSASVYREFLSQGALTETAMIRIRTMMKGGNVEARIIGLQNSERTVFLREISAMMPSSKITIVELDLFGSERRHVVVDIKTGMSYNLLIEDRTYRPGELASNQSLEDFERTLMPAAPAAQEQKKSA